ncbi:hypothetical protein EXU48_00425 [Occultella glacieicola]|uniref:PhnA-like protein n=1 Tax=Occultella glacieicola TaxID=2518684 RepID=A0ABY2E8A2_9MICO|nr:hypothetical protein [Occultella glacieicola]TDE98717.1 hypothetical protein EXU48_00425 [Occultella glacieicola]
MSTNPPVPPPPGNWRPGDYPAAGSPYAPDSILNPASTTNPPGRISLILGVVAVVLSVVGTIVQAVLIRQGWSPGTVGLGGGVPSLVGGAAAIGAVVTGIIGLRNPGPKGAAGAGTGIGASYLVGTLSTTLVWGLGSFF